MNKKNSKNIHPPKEFCEKCPDHGLCLAEDGKENYFCLKDKENEE